MNPAAALVLALLQAGTTPGILIDSRLAADLPAQPGDTLTAKPLEPGHPGQAFVVEGVFDRAADPNRIARNDYEVRFHLPDLERFLGQTNRVDRFAIALAPGADADSLAAWVESLAFGTRAFATADLAARASTTFLVISRFHDAIGLVTLLASGIFLLCLMVIRVDERRDDVRTLRLIGISRLTILRVIVFEAVAVASVASIVGIGIGHLLAWGVNRYYAAYYETTLQFAIVTPGIIATALGLGIALGVGAGFLAAFRIVNASPQRLGER